MAVSETSREAYQKLKSVGALSPQERQVYEQIKYMESIAKDEGDLPSRRDVAQMLGFETSTLSARVNALKSYGLVGEIKRGKVQASTGMSVDVLHIIDPNDKSLKQAGEAVRWLDD